jgi:hypothetical protein
MKSDGLPKILGIGFAIAVLVYVVSYTWIERRRSVHGPWEVHFASDATGTPSITIYQNKLNISAVEIMFSGERAARSNLNVKVSIEKPRQVVPFGQVIYDDLTFLPGVVTFHLFDHEIELMPRTLVIDRREVPWKSDSMTELDARGKLRPPGSNGPAVIIAPGPKKR